MPNFIQITPFMHVPDLAVALEFFCELLGFTVSYRQPGYAYVEREGCGMRLLQHDDHDDSQLGSRRFAYYIDVRDIDALHQELKPKLDELPPGDVFGPIDQPYSQRELLILAPDGNLLAFGQAIHSQTDQASK